jgi:hypothetical protein
MAVPNSSPCNGGAIGMTRVAGGLFPPRQIFSFIEVIGSRAFEPAANRAAASRMLAAKIVADQFEWKSWLRFDGSLASQDSPQAPVRRG